MPRPAVEESSRMSIRIDPKDKAMILRAARYRKTDLTSFVVSNSLETAKAIIAEEESIALSERDSLRVLDALENPPAPNAKLSAAARALPKLP